jgi:hypothetical protein
MRLLRKALLQQKSGHASRDTADYFPNSLTDYVLKKNGLTFNPITIRAPVAQASLGFPGHLHRRSPEVSRIGCLCWCSTHGGLANIREIHAVI